MNPSILVRKCETLDEFHACVELQRSIWGEQDLEVEPSTMFVVAHRTGGQVLGAFHGERLVGYTLAVVGLRDGAPYLHSHMTGVDSAYRDRGVGRLLKLFQREDAIRRGIRLIQWTFDPFELRNAHFNLNRLGALSRTYLPNLYGKTTSPLHRGLPTDRLLAEWYLESPRVVSAIENRTAQAPTAPARVFLPRELEDWKQKDSPELTALQLRIRDEFSQWFAKGYAATGTRTTEKGTEYLLSPWSDFL